jgi:acetyl esterase/lipase
VRGIHVHIHGGGWTIGDARMNDELNAALAAEAGLAVVSVDYRLIPNAPFAAVLDDCETAARWVLESGLAELKVGAMTIGGESAGAHLAAVTILRLRDRSPDFERLAGAALVYGCYDLGGTPGRRQAGPETLVLHGPSLSKLADKATGLDADARRDPSLSPLLAELGGLPPALFIVGDKDPLQDDSERMQAKWSAQSGNAELIVVPEAPHGFNHMPTSAAAKTNAYIRAWLGRRFGG